MAKKKGKGKKRAKAKKSEKPRDYKAEYRRRLKKALREGYSRRVARGHAGARELGIKAARLHNVKPGTDPFSIIERDASRVFQGAKPILQTGDGGAAGFQLRLEEQARAQGVFAWTDERQFVTEMQALGLTEREAYTQWFS